MYPEGTNLPFDHLLRTNRLLLRRFTAADSARVCEIQSNWNVTRMLRMASYPPTIEAISTWLSEHEGEWRSGTAYRFAVLFDDQLVGCADVDEIQGCSAEVGYWLDEAYWGQGLASEAAEAVQSFALNVLGLKRLETGHAIDNPASGRVLNKLGFKPAEKLLRWYQPRQEEIWHQNYVYEPVS